jgi:hypothetical protein
MTQHFECNDVLPRLRIRILNTMKLTSLFPLVPALSALVLLATPSTGLSDHKITVYQDRDHDGHYHKKKIEVPNRYYYGGGPAYYRPYGYRPYPYGYGPSVSISVGRTYSPSPSYYRESSYSDDLAVDVQRQLRRRGYYYGEIDGDVGPGTRSAIRAYQYDRGLPPSGRIDRSLVRALGLD